MKKKVIEFNLADMTEEKLVKILNDNNAGVGELLSLLEALFDMFSTSLRFSGVVFDYGRDQDPDFLDIFAMHITKRHGISPEKMVDVLNLIRGQAASASVH